MGVAKMHAFVGLDTFFCYNRLKKNGIHTKFSVLILHTSKCIHISANCSDIIIK